VYRWERRRRACNVREVKRSGTKWNEARKPTCEMASDKY
jgi:hypothetical protein